MFCEGYFLNPGIMLLGLTIQDDYEYQGATRLEIFLLFFAFCIVWGVEGKDV